MNLRPAPAKPSEIEKLWARGVPRLNIFGKLVPASIWVMRLPDTAYTAPVGAFWFVSTGRGR